MGVPIQLVQALIYCRALFNRYHHYHDNQPWIISTSQGRPPEFWALCSLSGSHISSPLQSIACTSAQSPNSQVQNLQRSRSGTNSTMTWFCKANLLFGSRQCIKNTAQSSV